MSWKDRISGKISEHSRDQVSHWHFCAVGEKLQLQHLKSRESNKVADWLCENHHELYKLGINFEAAVVCFDNKVAQKIYEEIQAYDLLPEDVPTLK